MAEPKKKKLQIAATAPWKGAMRDVPAGTVPKLNPTKIRQAFEDGRWERI